MIYDASNRILDEKKYNPRTVEVEVTKGIIIPTGVPYSNTPQNIRLKTTVSVDERENTQRELEQIADDTLRRWWTEWDRAFKKRDTLPPDFRTTTINGKIYPHVTSILGDGEDLSHIPHLDKHAHLGTNLDEVAKVWSEEGFIPYWEVDGGEAGNWDDLFFAFCDWVKKYGDRVEFLAANIKAVNHEHVYCGEADMIGILKDKNGNNPVITLFDFKKTKATSLTKKLRDKYHMQMSSYAVALRQMFDIQQICIISPYRGLVVEKNIERYYADFLKLRKNVKDKYGI